MLDNKGRLFGKVSIVDLLVVVIIAVMLVGAFTAYQKIHNKSILTENKSLGYHAPERSAANQHGCHSCRRRGIYEGYGQISG